MSPLELTITQKIMLGTSMLGIVAGVVGSFAVLRRRALVGDMLAHTALPGVCLAFLVVGHRSLPALLFGALISGLIGIGAMTVIARWTRTKEDAAIGIVLGAFFGLGLVLLAMIQRMPLAGRAGLNQFLFGQTAGMLNRDLVVIVSVSVVCLTLIALVYKEFKLFSFDPDFAQSQGWPTLLLDLTMMGTLAVVTVVGLPIVGVVLMAALVIIPGAAARFWTNRLGTMLVIAGSIGGGMGLIGSTAFAGSGLPTGPVIVLVGAAVFVLSVLFAPQRGVVAQLFESINLQRVTARENLLRTLYELSEPELPELPTIAEEKILDRRAWSRPVLKLLLRRAVRRELVTLEGAGVRLTGRGLNEAVRITRTHRLWELFLIDNANIAPDHVDRDADAIEHLLSPELVQQLESRLAANGQLPSRGGVVPVSPHDETPVETMETHHG